MADINDLKLVRKLEASRRAEERRGVSLSTFARVCVCIYCVDIDVTLSG